MTRILEVECNRCEGYRRDLCALREKLEKATQMLRKVWGCPTSCEGCLVAIDCGLRELDTPDAGEESAPSLLDMRGALPDIIPDGETSEGMIRKIRDEWPDDAGGGEEEK